MLKNTFTHIPTIGPKTEQELWRAGLTSWDKLAAMKDLPLSAAKQELLIDTIDQSQKHLVAENAAYFYKSLAANQQWRMFPHFRHSIAYLDIETTGLGNPGDYITTIALYDGKTIRHYVHDDNLMDFKNDISEYQMLVTYNGKMFDLPFIRSYLNAPMEQAHIDLRFPLASLGYRGGLKACERTLGIEREDVEDIDGYFAVLLWHDYNNNGNKKALETLLAYNIMDTVNLEMLAVLTYNKNLEGTPFEESHRLPLPTRPETPFAADADTIRKIKRGSAYSY